MNKPVLKHLGLFFIKFVIIYMVLMLQPFKDMYADFSKSQHQKRFGKFGERGAILIQEPEVKKPMVMYDLLLLNNAKLEEGKAKGQAQVVIDYYGKMSCNWYSYILYGFVIAFIIALPIGWKRKLFALPAGLVLVYLYWLFSQWLGLTYWFNEFHTLEVLQLKGFLKTFVIKAYPVVVENPGTLAFVGLLIVLAVSFRKSDWDAVTEYAIA